MEKVSIDISKPQLKKLQKGSKVRIKQGTGFNLLINPNSYNVVTKNFKKNKASTISLSLEELDANKKFSEEQESIPNDGSMVGSGIFGRSFDKKVIKTIGKRNKKELYDVLEDYKLPLKTALNAGIAAGTASLSIAQPELAPFITPAAYGLATYISNYIDEPSRYQSKPKKKDIKKYKGIGKNIVEDEANNYLNRKLGTNYGYQNKGAISDLYNGLGSEDIANYGFSQLRRPNMIGNGVQQQRTKSYIDDGKYFRPTRMYGRGSRLDPYNTGDSLIPALKSQPEGANFQFRHTLPIEYLGEGNYAIGNGLYLGNQGRGLGT